MLDLDGRVHHYQPKGACNARLQIRKDPDFILSRMIWDSQDDLGEINHRDDLGMEHHLHRAPLRGQECGII